MGLSLVGFLLPIALLIQLMIASAPRDLLYNLFGEDLIDSFSIYLVSILLIYFMQQNDTCKR